MTMNDQAATLDSEAVHRHLESFRANDETIDSSWEMLVADHDGEWVASSDGSLLFGATLEAVIAKARARGWPLDVVAVRRLAERPAMLL